MAWPCPGEARGRSFKFCLWGIRPQLWNKDASGGASVVGLASPQQTTLRGSLLSCGCGHLGYLEDGGPTQCWEGGEEDGMDHPPCYLSAAAAHGGATPSLLLDFRPWRRCLYTESVS